MRDLTYKKKTVPMKRNTAIIRVGWISTREPPVPTTVCKATYGWFEVLASNDIFERRGRVLIRTRNVCQLDAQTRPAVKKIRH
jgi:hypothetical protein